MNKKLFFLAIMFFSLSCVQKKEIKLDFLDAYVILNLLEIVEK